MTRFVAEEFIEGCVGSGYSNSVSNDIDDILCRPTYTGVYVTYICTVTYSIFIFIYIKVVLFEYAMPSMRHKICLEREHKNKFINQ